MGFVPSGAAGKLGKAKAVGGWLGRRSLQKGPKTLSKGKSFGDSAPMMPMGGKGRWEGSPHRRPESSIVPRF
jgi:hypothetical protein